MYIYIATLCENKHFILHFRCIFTYKVSCCRYPRPLSTSELAKFFKSDFLGMNKFCRAFSIHFCRLDRSVVGCIVIYCRDTLYILVSYRSPLSFLNKIHNILSYRIVSYRIVSYRIVSYRYYVSLKMRNRRNINFQGSDFFLCHFSCPMEKFFPKVVFSIRVLLLSARLFLVHNAIGANAISLTILRILLDRRHEKYFVAVCS